EQPGRIDAPVLFDHRLHMQSMVGSGIDPHGAPNERWTAGAPLLGLCAALWGWWTTLAWRFLDGPEFAAGALWLAAAAVWLGAQIVAARLRLPERFAGVFSTAVQALVPVLATAGAVAISEPLRGAVMRLAASVSTTELIAIHVLRLAAWGTIKKYRAGLLPRYFFLSGSIPDFAFAVSAVALTAFVITQGAVLSDTGLLIWNAVGVLVFLGAAVTMYFGAPKSPLGWRWRRVVAGREASTLAPFRWPMNLAPAFCAPLFWLAHGLFVIKLLV
ncbi:MAG: hypothetical protein AAGC56_03870, partial [Pseudomonadota bacterium]